MFPITHTDPKHLRVDGYLVTRVAPGDTPASPWRNDVSLDTCELVKRVLLETLPSLFLFR